MAVTENRVAGLQERLKEVMKCEQLNKQQFMKVTDISNIGRKLDGNVAITNVYISKMKHSLLVNDQWLETICRALGNSVLEKTVTAIYVKYDNKKIDEANRKVIDYLNG